MGDTMPVGHVTPSPEVGLSGGGGAPPQILMGHLDKVGQLANVAAAFDSLYERTAENNDEVAAAAAENAHLDLIQALYQAAAAHVRGGLNL